MNKENRLKVKEIFVFGTKMPIDPSGRPGHPARFNPYRLLKHVAKASKKTFRECEDSEGERSWWFLCIPEDYIQDEAKLDLIWESGKALLQAGIVDRDYREDVSYWEKVEKNG